MHQRIGTFIRTSSTHVPSQLFTLPGPLTCTQTRMDECILTTFYLTCIHEHTHTRTYAHTRIPTALLYPGSIFSSLWSDSYSGIKNIYLRVTKLQLFVRWQDGCMVWPVLHPFGEEDSLALSSLLSPSLDFLPSALQYVHANKASIAGQLQRQQLLRYELVGLNDFIWIPK